MKRNRDARDDDSSDDDRYEENKAQKMSKSPTEKEMDIYVAVAKKLHKAGQIDPTIAEAAGCFEVRLTEGMNKQRKDLIKEVEKEGRYFSDLRKKVLLGKKTPTKAEFEEDCARMKGKQKDIGVKISALEKVRRSLRAEGIEVDAKAVDYITPDTTLDTSVDTSDVFTDADDDLPA